jgi:hypothetical protein
MVTPLVVTVAAMGVCELTVEPADEIVVGDPSGSD